MTTKPVKPAPQRQVRSHPLHFPVLQQNCATVCPTLGEQNSKETFKKNLKTYLFSFRLDLLRLCTGNFFFLSWFLFCFCLLFFFFWKRNEHVCYSMNISKLYKLSSSLSFNVFDFDTGHKQQINASFNINSTACHARIRTLR